MNNVETFELIKWTDAHIANTVYNLSGSAPVPLTIKGLTALSSDPEATARNLGSLDSIPLGLSSHPLIRQNIAETIFRNSKAGITAEHVLTTVGSTGGNALIIQCLLQPGEHVIVQYPTFAQLLGIPKALPRVDVSLWKMDPSKGWDADIDQLRGLIRKGKTKLIILNNPHNPTGYSLPTEQCREIVRLAKENDVWLHVDEIFRPLFHEPGADASSFMEYTSEHSKIVVTGSVSKAWALAGLRVGWIVTKEKSVLDACYNMISYTFNECGTLDEIIAAEALSSRCRDNILTRTLDQAQTNISLLEKFVQRNNKTVSWTKPTAGATAFVQFFKDRRPVNDVDFCEKLKASTGVLLVPGSLCFGDGPKETGGQEGQDINGFVRWHLTGSTEVMEKGIALIEAFLRDGFDAVQTAGSLFLPRI